VRQLTAGAFTIAAAVSTMGCYRMRPVTLEQLGAAEPGLVWITRTDQSVVVVETPRVFGDTLTGYINGEFHELPSTDLRYFRVKQMAGARTMGLVAAAAVGVGTFVGMISSTGKYVDPTASMDCEDPQTPGCPNANP
jgi:hypothetical protein